MRITYWGHSGFQAEVGNRQVLMDYIGGGLPTPAVGSGLLALVSHGHSDHWLPELETWRQEGRLSLVAGIGVQTGGTVLRPGERTEIEGICVEAFGSTDEGVSFLIRTAGRTIFHAGDLNLWHWRHESTPQEVEAAEQAFDAVLQSLRGIPVDVAFFPADPRMGTGFEEGFLRYAEAIRPKLLIPMHFWNRPEALEPLWHAPLAKGVELRILTRPGERTEILPD